MTRTSAEKLAVFCGRAERLSAVLAVFLLVVNVMDIVMGVVLRYFFGASVVWTEEVARYSLVWLVLFGAASAMARGEHMSVDFLVNKFPSRLQKIAWLIRMAVQVCVLSVLIWFGARNVAGTWQMKTMALGIPKAFPLMAVPIGMAMLLVQLLAQEWRDFLLRKEEGGR